ncbi:F-box/FBD/LRR-repeat protein At1g13570-like isoform X2 [Ipomoea triloba]|uniref:F-box/FBD/LRR-repeat protein At1g13570-like isoform X2 n=1 Tax=Ipomoea triloba TaxID=35885 RepID=UPI00125E1089|nr:F-box/FBD/LRR-repeat protein At1g13570-like isoform X2 [Ipomoea triloba]
MARRLLLRIVPDASRDLISELPLELKVRILECLPTRDAARTALLSTHWNHVWLRLGRLAFDFDFLYDIRKCSGKSIVPYKIITYILLHRVQPVKKFSLHLCALFDPTVEQSDLDEWCLYLSRNGIEELDISCSSHCPFKLPFCIVWCPTIKQLELWGLGFDCPINAPSIFPGVTSLIFLEVVFNHNVNGIVSSIPNLEKLEFFRYEGISNFKFRAPKLESLSIFGFIPGVEYRWLALHLESVKVLCLDLDSMSKWENVEVASFPTAINLQVIKLDSINFANEKQVMGVLKLLQKSPNLCELHITVIFLDDDIQDDDIQDVLLLLKDPDSCIVNQDLKMLKTIKIRLFTVSTVQMLFVKMLLSKSPTLENVVFLEKYYCHRQYNDYSIYLSSHYPTHF